VRAVGLLLEDAALAHLRPRAHARLLQEDGFREIPALELDPRTELAIVDGDRRLAAENAPARHDRVLPVDPAAGVKPDPVPGDPVDVHLVADVDGRGVRDVDPFPDQAKQRFPASRLKVHAPPPGVPVMWRRRQNKRIPQPAVP